MENPLTTPKELEEKILSLLNSSDLLNTPSPHLPRTFSKWRIELYSAYTGTQSSFISIIDQTYFPMFISLLTSTYKFSISNEPSLHDIPKTDKAASEMIEILTDWSVQIEVLLDLISRSKVYGLYSVSESFDKIYFELQKEWKNESQSNFFYRYLVNYFSTISSHLKSILSGKISSYMMNGLVQMHSYSLARVLSAYFSIGMPYPILCMLGVHFLCSFVGILSSKIGDKLFVPIEKVNIHLKLAEIKKELKGMTDELKQKNAEIENLILAALSDPGAQRKLRKTLDKMIDQPESIQDLSYLDNVIYQYSSFHEDEDWVVIDPPPLYSELIDDWGVIE